MENLSISDIVWNLKSGFREISFEDAELVLIQREQQLKVEKVTIEDKYNGVLQENDALKKKCDTFQTEKKEEVFRWRELNKKFRNTKAEVIRARHKIWYMEMVCANARRRANKAVGREEEESEDNARLRLKIKALEDENEEAERDLKGEIQKLLQKIGCLEKEKEEAFAQTENLKNVVNSFKERIHNLMEDSSLNLSSTTHAGLNPAYDGDVADLEDRLDYKIKEESDGKNSGSPPKLFGQNANLSLLVRGKPTNIHLLNGDGLKRKRDSSGSSSAGNLSYGPVNHSVLAVASSNDQSVSKSTTAINCSDDNLDADASWQFESAMLSAIDTDPILTMKAVCALYRQHKSSLSNLNSGSAFPENRGFDSIHAFRGTILAEFLLNGDPQSGMNRSVEELQIHDAKGVDDCKTIASTHSRKLFEIYQRQEDPFFGPK